jgi:predicted RNA methylase
MEAIALVCKRRSNKWLGYIKYNRDYIESVATLKIEHEWQQSTTEAEYIIKNLTLANQTVLDPMMGSGTIGLATLNLKRKFIGIEKNPETFEIAKVRINKQQEFEGIKEEDD